VKYFDRHFSLPTGYRFLLRDVLRFVQEIDAQAPSGRPRLLDVGCGQMPYKRLFARYEYLGLDNKRESGAQPDVEGSVLALPFPERSFEAVLTVWVLDDFLEIETAISEIARVLKPGGLYFAVENQATNIHNAPHDYFRLAPAAMRALCERHGLVLLRRRSFAGDFGNVGFSLVIICELAFGLLRLRRFVRPVYCLLLSTIFRPLDLLARHPRLKGCFETNSLGYCYVFERHT
jgi:SAM-dependent methyltransferase